ncbi:MAG TPA: ABC transporter ATP-binding protein [Polyangia bacterium]|nr:ABC transporter ATP-binding protein [Polyangia bacterium]
MTARTGGFDDCAWPLEARAELTQALAGAAGIRRRGPSERFEVAYASVAPALGGRARVPAPSVLRAGAGAGQLLAIVGYAGSRVRLLVPGGGVVHRDAAALAAWLRAPSEARVGGDVAAAVARAKLSPTRAEAVTAALLASAAGADRLAEGTRLTAARPSMAAALRAAGAWSLAGAALAGYVAQLGLLVALWSVAGAQAIGGRVAAAWTLAGLICALAAARLASSWAAGQLSIQTGAVLRGRVMDGILALDPEPLRTAGIGQLMGRVADLEAVESLALGGGLAAAAGLFELATGMVVVALGVAPVAHLLIAGATVAAAAGLIGRLRPALDVWTSRRLTLTHDLVERMAGQRTVVAQQPAALWHRDEARALQAYGEAGGRLDARASALVALAPRAWLLGAVAALVPHARAASAHPAAFVASVGGVLFVASAFRKLAQAVPALGSAAIAWRNLRLLAAEGAGGATVGAEPPSPVAAGSTPSPGIESPLVEARDLAFRYPGRPAPVLEGCSFAVRAGDRVLVEGASGGGKSTLAALLAGMREPTAGTLRLGGVEQAALGPERWRARIGGAPQFHENHVFSASLAFNLLLGRAWPPRQEDVAEAEAICRELDLGPLLARMPSGMEQLVGESGWQLSHGERGRLFIARALLQPLDARILDESFAALDPETLERAVACVFRRAGTLIVIAHP